MYGSPEASQNLTFAQRVAWLRLIRSSNVGPTTFRQLINKFGSAEAALEILPELTRRGGSKASPKIATAQSAEYELEQLNKMGTHGRCGRSRLSSPFTIHSLTPTHDFHDRHNCPQ